MDPGLTGMAHDDSANRELSAVEIPPGSDELLSIRSVSAWPPSPGSTCPLFRITGADKLRPLSLIGLGSSPSSSSSLIMNIQNDQHQQ
jgi:hypothetical protein